jgi:nitrogen fixation/metabolism regulation signal transduction histidine kinase
MTRLFPRICLFVAISLYAVTLADVASGFSRLSMGIAIVLGLACLAGAAFLISTSVLRKGFVPLVLLASVFLTVATRLVGYETVVHRPPEEWHRYQQQLALGIAEKVTLRFSELCGEARSATENLARHPALARSVDAPESRDELLKAFEVLDSAVLPQPAREAVAGATLYDGSNRPLAWTGKNADLMRDFEVWEDGSNGRTFVLEQGVLVYLVAIEPLPGGRGAVTVEIPLAARRRLNNRYQSDYEVVEVWAAKSLVTDYVDAREQAPELAELFDRSGDHYWGGTQDAPVLYFPLRSPAGRLLAVLSLAAEDPAAAVVEHRRETARLAGIILALAALAIVVLLAVKLLRSFENDRWGIIDGLYFAVAVCGLRVVLLYANVPIGFGTDADNPVHYASSIFLDFLRSPADFVATGLATVVCGLALVLPLLAVVDSGPPRPRGRLARFLIRVAISAAVLSLILLANGIVRDTWINSNLALANPGLGPPDPPRLAVQLGLLCLFLATALLGVFLFSLTERLSGGQKPLSFRGLLQCWGVDLLVLAAAWIALSPTSISDWIAPSLFPLLTLDLLVFLRIVIRDRLQRGALYERFAVGLAMLVLTTLSYYPAIALFENKATRQFVESTVARAVVHHGDSRQYVLMETLETIDRMEFAGRLSLPERADLAFQVWSRSGLSMSAMNSSVEIYDEAGGLVSQFALNFPSSELEWHQPDEPDEGDWIIWEDPYPGESRPLVINARRAMEGADGELWDVRVRLVADWSNLPFVSTPNPYIDVFRSPGTEPTLPSPHAELTLHVFESDGRPIFQSSRIELTVDSEILRRAREEQLWVHTPVDEQHHHILVFSDADYLYALSYPGKGALGYAAELVGWAILSALTAAGMWLIYLVVSFLGGSFRFELRDLWADFGTSFYGKLFAAFIFLALVPTVMLAFLAQGIVVQQLERDVEQEGFARARVVERFVRDYLLYERSERRMAAVDDALLDWVGSLVDADVDLYSQGELVATSKRELFAGGLLSARAVPSVYEDIVLKRANQSLHRESVGTFQYLVVSVPTALEYWEEPGILSLPLASRQPEIDRRVASLNQTVLLAAICFAVLAAFLAYSLARRIAEPINTLTAATRRVAQGDFEVSISAPSRDEIGHLSESFNQMTSDLKRQRKDLERTKKLEAWAEMARQVAHDVKNPLTPIQLSTEHLLRVFGDPRVDYEKVLKDCTDTILQQVRTLRQISMEFSTFSSPSRLEPESTDFSRLVNETLGPYQQAPPPGVTVNIDVASSIPTIVIDRRLIQRTLINLLENAFHAMNGGGQVTVTVSPIRQDGKDWIEVEVSDTGEGIDPELLERIFEPYFSTRVAGTGLGLAISRKAVEEHGGTISLESEPGVGTQVRIRLPVTADPMEKT